MRWERSAASIAQQHGRQIHHQNRSRNHTFRDLLVLDAVYIYLREHCPIRYPLPLSPSVLPCYMSDRGQPLFFPSFQFTVRSPAGMLGLTFLNYQPSRRLARLGRQSLIL